ncbi:MAG TPA: response regulator transcription factor [Blastocatellia bacterium]|nr:response regulator transcription factor [Blastocatellia bacterium]
MKILVAEDNIISRRLLESALNNWGYEVISAHDGAEAWEHLQQEGAPSLAILDWMMPHLTGLDLCHRIRSLKGRLYTYIILLTARDDKQDLVMALDAGADDFVIKPFNPGELRSRLRVGERILALEQSLINKVTELEQAVAQVKQLKELLPICMYCKKIRDDQNYWHQVEHYLYDHAGTDFSHGICPECLPQVMPANSKAMEG